VGREFAGDVSTGPTIVWFRRDLRLRDNPALQAAVASGGPVVPLYIWDPEGEGHWAPGAASRWWLHHSLAALAGALEAKGSRLVVAQGPAGDVLERMVDALEATAVYWNRCYEPAVVARDTRIKARLAERGVKAVSNNGALLHEPQTVANRQGQPFQVFTPYWRTCLARAVEEPGPREPERLMAPIRWPATITLETLDLRPRLNWADEWSREWQPGEAGAQAAWRRFLRDRIHAYDEGRDRPGEAGTSKLSAHLHFGEISVRQIWADVKAQGKESGVYPPSNGARVFLAELGWREFAHHQLFHFPHTVEEPLREQFRDFPWRSDPGGRLLQAWQRGQTGYPLVDAGLRQLWATGWMHNRVRMVVASFLVKHLRLPWQDGARWFWDTLVDADLANNTLGWQWSAGCGADAAPYFRIFNPVTQATKFDASGRYVAQWVPELARLPVRLRHAPWQASPAEQAAAGVELGRTYPYPIVEHAAARAEALAAYQQLRQKGAAAR
jgi:deoxyribodipyrimidine photo-lyase